MVNKHIYPFTQDEWDELPSYSKYYHRKNNQHLLRNICDRILKNKVESSKNTVKPDNFSIETLYNIFHSLLEYEKQLKKLNEVPTEIIKEVVVEKIVEVPTEVIKYVEVPTEIIKEVIKEVEVEKIVEIIKEVPIEVIKNVELPTKKFQQSTNFIEVEKLNKQVEVLNKQVEDLTKQLKYMEYVVVKEKNYIIDELENQIIKNQKDKR